jgi:hypothetical protein
MRNLFKSLIGLSVIFVLALCIALFIGWASVPDLIATNLSKKLKVAVDVREVDLSWKSLKIEKINIANPEKSSLARAFSAEIVEVKTPIEQYLHREIVIAEVVVDEIYLGLEFDSPTSKRGNWTILMDNFAATTPPEKASITRRSALIRKLILRNINTDLLYRTEGATIQHLPPIAEIVLTDISSEGAFPINQIASSILGRMLHEIFEKENLEQLLEKSVEEPVEIISKPLLELIP